MGKNSIERRKNELKDVNSDLEKREKQVSDLQDRYNQAMDARMELEGMDGIDEEVKEHFREASAEKLEELHEEGEELANEMIDENNRINEIREANAEAYEENEKGARKAEKFDSITGANTSEKFEQNAAEIQEVQDAINDSQKKIDDLSNRARNLSKRGDSF